MLLICSDSGFCFCARVRKTFSLLSEHLWIKGVSCGYYNKKQCNNCPRNVALLPYILYIGVFFGYFIAKIKKIVFNSYRRVRHIEAEPITRRLKMRLLALYLFLCYRKVHCNMVGFKVGRLANFFARISSLLSLLMQCLVFCLYNFRIGLGCQSFKENAQYSLNRRCKVSVLIGTHSDTLCLYHPAQCTNTAL